MNDTTERLILQRLDEISTKIDNMRDDLHKGERRMDGFERTIETLTQTDLKQAGQLKELESKVAELEPIREVVGKLKTLFYLGAALAILLAAMPWIKPFVGK